jgi:hypothetical protein
MAVAVPGARNRGRTRRTLPLLCHQLAILRRLPRTHGDLVPEHQQFGVVDAGERPSRTSQPASRTKIR